MRVIADHLRGATFLAVDGVVPSNKEQGYVMRRLMRRAIRFAFDLGIEQGLCEQVVPVIADIYHEDFPEVAERRDQVIETLVKEEKIFRQTLRKGIHEMSKMTADGLNGAEVFKLYDTYGFPVELSVEEAFKQGIDVSENWRAEFDQLMAEQRHRSQTASKGVFKGGLGGQTLQHKKYHTATHLMYQALRDVLGDHVVQRGSNITEERLRFDFSHDGKVTPEQIEQVEKIVNEQIGNDLKVSWAEYPTPEATGPLGALGQFGDRYGDTVKVYKMIADGADKPFSFEICGGPHVDHTHQLLEDGKTLQNPERRSQLGRRPPYQSCSRLAMSSGKEMSLPLSEEGEMLTMAPVTWAAAATMPRFAPNKGVAKFLSPAFTKKLRGLSKPIKRRTILRSIEEDKNTLTWGLYVSGRGRAGTLLTGMAEIEYDPEYPKRVGRRLATWRPEMRRRGIGRTTVKGLVYASLGGDHPFDEDKPLEEKRGPPLTAKIRRHYCSLGA